MYVDGPASVDTVQCTACSTYRKNINDEKVTDY